MNLKTAARRLGVHYQTAYRWVRSGQLVAVKVGAGYEISDAARRALPSAARRDGARARDARERTDVRPPADRGHRRAARSSRTMVDVHDRRRHRGRTSGRRTRSQPMHRRRASPCSLRDADGSLRLAAFDAPRPGAEVGRDRARCCASATPTNRCTRVAPPRPAKPCSCRRCRSANVRTQVRPELHQRLDDGRVATARSSAPIVGTGVVRGSVLVVARHARVARTRSRTATSSSRSRCASAPRSRRPNAGTRRGRCAPRARERSGRVGRTRRLRRALRMARWTRSPTANPSPCIDLDMSVDAATTAFADQFGTTASDLKEQSMRDLVEDGRRGRGHVRPAARRRVRLLHATSMRPVGRGRTPVVLARRDRPRSTDATPCCVLLRRARGPRRRARLSVASQRVPFAPRDADWGHATDARRRPRRGRDRRHRRDRVHEGVGPHRARDRRRGRRAGDRRRRARTRRHRRAHVVGRVRRLRRRRVPRALRHDARDVDVAVGRRHGVGRDRAVPRGAGDPRRARPRHVLNVFPVAWATQRGVDDRRPGRGARRAVAEAEPRSAVRLVPAARVLRDDHAPAHARVRHDRGAVRRGRGRVPAPRQPASRTR